MQDLADLDAKINKMYVTLDEDNSGGLTFEELRMGMKDLLNLEIHFTRDDFGALCLLSCLCFLVFIFLDFIFFCCFLSCLYYWGTCRNLCASVCLSACLPVCLLACLPACLLAYALALALTHTHTHTQGL